MDLVSIYATLEKQDHRIKACEHFVSFVNKKFECITQDAGVHCTTPGTSPSITLVDAEIKNVESR